MGEHDSGAGLAGCQLSIVTLRARGLGWGAWWGGGVIVRRPATRRAESHDSRAMARGMNLRLAGETKCFRNTRRRFEACYGDETTGRHDRYS